MCGHMCSKKVNPTIVNHDCCGRCRLGRDCQSAAKRDYDDPGTFAHNYFEASLRPGVCGGAGEPSKNTRGCSTFTTGVRHRRGS